MRTGMVVLCCLCAWGASSSLCADSFLLRNGGRLEGEWHNPKRQPDDAYELTTSAGLRLTLPRDQVAKVFIKTDVELEYERQLPRMPATAEGNWKMAEWCREANLKSKREYHLRETMRLDAEHEGARVALGFQKYDGVWRKPEEQMKLRGYVRYDGRWLTPQDIELVRRSGENNELVVEWRQKIRIWKSWLGKKRDLEARANFRSIDDPFAAPTLIELLEDDENSRDLRLLALAPLALLEGRPGEGTFITLAINDNDEKIREKCSDALVKYQSRLAVRRAVKMLSDDDNLVVRRSAALLTELKDREAVLPLIDALITTHEFVVVPGQASPGGLGPMSSSFGRDSAGNTYGGGGNGGMVFGSPRPRKEKREVQNDAVLSALTATVEGVNYAFNEAAWRKWYIQEHEPAKVNLRRGE